MLYICTYFMSLFCSSSMEGSLRSFFLRSSLNLANCFSTSSSTINQSHNNNNNNKLTPKSSYQSPTFLEDVDFRVCKECLCLVVVISHYLILPLQQNTQQSATLQYANGATGPLRGVRLRYICKRV